MKRFVFCLLLLALLLSACSSYGTGSVYTVEHNGMTFTVDAYEWTITHGEDIYQVQYDQTGAETTIRIIYPNGATYSRTQSGSITTSGKTPDYDPQRYVPAELLVTVLEQYAQPVTEKSTGSLILGVACILIGAFNFLLPELAWRVQYGWVYKNAEPTHFALLLNRITGIIAALLGVILTFL